MTESSPSRAAHSRTGVTSPATVRAIGRWMPRLLVASMAALVGIGGLLAIASATGAPASATAPSSHVAAHSATGCSGYLATGTVVAMVATRDDGGYWIANQAGQVVACGDAPDLGSLSGPLARPVVGMAATPSGGGFYLVASDGGIFSFGDARFQGSTGALTLNRPVVGMAVDAATGGYWLVASDGGIFAFGAPFAGSTGALTLNRPVVGMAASPSGTGYWLVATDGGIFAFGVPFLGSMGAVSLNRPVVGMATDLATGGYWLVASDGGIFSYGAPFHGSTGSIVLNLPIVGMEASPSGAGYRFVATDGGVFAFNTAFYGSAVAPPPPPPPPGTSSGLRVGPGPQASYSVQPQPAAGSCHYRYSGVYPLPDPSCTPGSISPAVTQANINSTICVSGYTATVRPPSNITSAEKIGSAAAYGYTGSFSTGEYDHLVPLELGGDPNDPANLWVEPNDRAGATSVYNTKDTLENRLRVMVCAGQLALATAQQAIASNWAVANQTYP